MTPFSGLLFFYIMGLLLLPACILGLMGKSLRHYGFIFTVLMLIWVFGENGQLLSLAVFAIWQIALCLVFFHSHSKSRLIFILVIILSLLPIAAVKIGELFPALGTRQLLGVSYMTFRGVQVLLDIRDDRLKELRLLDLCYFLLFFPSVSSGPIDRYQRFVGDLRRTLSRAEYIDMLRRGVWKLMFGAFSAIVVSGLINQYWLAALPPDGFLATLLYMYGYTLYLFFNFAGYSSMAIGTAHILGVSLPENFNMPFLSVDMKDFWSRWHISLSTWLRDYVYTRFVRGALRARRFKNPRTASYLGYALNMITMGVWHGLTPSYLLYGAYHALLMSLNEALDLHWKAFRKLKQKGFSQFVAVFITFHLFSFGLLIFSGRLFS
ncbi:MAG: D-alanyl-lipoteichoic acid biosynthesis protein DltB [Oscillospiraceae bacterium]|jgi:membrane protein involved in D-alanine export|nr:D-alanyl-lipoteichoic acid biosynthesis protein DltB [Oscillospiraceae bacterium]